MDELLLRIGALLRRSKGNPKLCSGGLCLDEVHRSITLDSRLLNLTVKEYQLLALMIRHADKVVTKEMIMHEGGLLLCGGCSSSFFFLQLRAKIIRNAEIKIFNMKS